MGQKQKTNDSSFPYGHLEKLCFNIWRCHQDTSGKTDILVNLKSITYNHATSNLAIYSHETSQDKLPEA